MLESEKSSLFGRVHDLERRVLTQQDEIVCLRSTLADVLRRLNTIEGNIERGAISNNTLNIQGGRSAPNTPSRNGAPIFNRCKNKLIFVHISIHFDCERSRNPNEIQHKSHFHFIQYHHKIQRIRIHHWA